MTQVCSVYSQLLQLFSRGQFAQAVNQHQADCNAKGLSSWGQFVAMLFCQMAHLNSLRELCLGLASCESPLKHLGISITPKKSTSRMPRQSSVGTLRVGLYVVAGKVPGGDGGAQLPGADQEGCPHFAGP